MTSLHAVDIIIKWGKIEFDKIYNFHRTNHTHTKIYKRPYIAIFMHLETVAYKHTLTKTVLRMQLDSICPPNNTEYKRVSIPCPISLYGWSSFYHFGSNEHIGHFLQRKFKKVAWMLNHLSLQEIKNKC